MEPSPRRSLGVLAILAFAVGWAVVVASFSGAIARQPGWAQALIYAVAGLIWIAPLRPALRWIETGRWR